VLPVNAASQFDARSDVLLKNASGNILYDLKRRAFARLTVHPSYILRPPTTQQPAETERSFAT
jgi:hypothetical protein